MLELLIAGSNLFGSGWHFIYLTQNHFRFETKKKEYQSLGSLRESDPPATQATPLSSLRWPNPYLKWRPSRCPVDPVSLAPFTETSANVSFCLIT